MKQLFKQLERTVRRGDVEATRGLIRGFVGSHRKLSEYDVDEMMFGKKHPPEMLRTLLIALPLLVNRKDVTRIWQNLVSRQMDHKSDVLRQMYRWIPGEVIVKACPCGGIDDCMCDKCLLVRKGYGRCDRLMAMMETYRNIYDPVEGLWLMYSMLYSSVCRSMAIGNWSAFGRLDELISHALVLFDRSEYRKIPRDFLSMICMMKRYNRAARKIQRTWRRTINKRIGQNISRICHAKGLSPGIARMIHEHCYNSMLPSEAEYAASI